jgi:hypothetical protein
MMPIYRFLRNIFIALDRLFNVLLLGSCDETISERTERLRASGSRTGCAMCKAMSIAFRFLRKDHCQYALENGRKLGVEFWHWCKL